MLGVGPRLCAGSFPFVRIVRTVKKGNGPSQPHVSPTRPSQHDQSSRLRLKLETMATYLTSRVDVDVVLGVLGVRNEGLDQELP